MHKSIIFETTMLNSWHKKRWLENIFIKVNFLKAKSGTF